MLSRQRLLLIVKPGPPRAVVADNLRPGWAVAEHLGRDWAVVAGHLGQFRNL